MARRPANRTILVTTVTLVTLGVFFTFFTIQPRGVMEADRVADEQMYAMINQLSDRVRETSNLVNQLAAGQSPRALPAASQVKQDIPGLVQRQQQQQQQQAWLGPGRAVANPNPAVQQPPQPQILAEQLDINKELFLSRPKASVSDLKGDCSLALRTRTPSAVEVDELYTHNSFSNPDGGVWKQGWDVRYSPTKYGPSNKLRVFVVPHSHNDPGWIKTVDEYFRQQTNNILTLMTQKMSEDPSLKFVWAEMSYLSMWWDQASPSLRSQMKSLVERGQLEIVSGGWVMPDEANTHFFAIIDQLIEGHEWLKSTLGVKPRSGWSIDPFGHSPTVAYILKRSGMTGMVIQRIHYEMKRMLAEKKHLEFNWKQDWDRGSDTSMLSHMMPFYSYDVPHTCGPDPSVCCQFDFARLKPSKYTCPWKKPPQAITAANVEERANTLLDQYKKKAELYATNNLLIPLGDDFRYDKTTEINAQVTNYKALFDHINKRDDVEIRFGTLSDYFDAVYEETRSQLSSQTIQSFPTLSGDFFSYADRDDHYWTGYFTSRPFFKHMDRLLEAKLRAAEILFSIGGGGAKTISSSLYDKLTLARRQLGVFQHHDGITGTAKDHVVNDYGNRLMNAIDAADSVSSAMLQTLQGGTASVSPTARRVRFDAIPEDAVLGVGTFVTVYNSLTRNRKEFVRIRVQSTDMEVADEEGKFVRSQCNPVPQGASFVYDLWFEVDIPPLAIKTYELASKPTMIETFNPPQGTLPEVHVANAAPPQIAGIETKQIQSDWVELSTNSMTATINAHTGLLEKVRFTETNLESRVRINFMTYGTTPKRDKSGAYLFMPDGAARPLSAGASSVFVIKGDYMSEVRTQIGPVQHVLRIFDSESEQGASVSVVNEILLTTSPNTEVIMRLQTDVENGETFFTDLNGFQMRKRKYWSKLPLNANFYPMPSQMFIEDTHQRVSLQTRSPLGVAALQPGQMEVVLDRRLMQDDNRGLGQGVKDNRQTRLEFNIVVEGREAAGEHSVPNPTLLGHALSDILSHPIFTFSSAAKPANLVVQLAQTPPPCDVFLLNARSLDASASKAAILLHRRGFVCGFTAPSGMCASTGGKVDLGGVFTPGVSSVKEKSLTLMHDMAADHDQSHEALLVPMEVYAFEVTFNR